MAHSNGNPALPSSSGTLNTQNTIISQHAHMKKSRGISSSMYPIDSASQGSIREPKPGAEDNVQPRFELFLLGEDQKKVTEEPDTRMPSTSIFTFNKEDHTLGNMLRSRLLQMEPQVIFAGYKVPHPLFSTFLLRVQTDGSLTPRAALSQACRDLVNDLSLLSREFTKEWELRKMVGVGAEEANGEN